MVARAVVLKQRQQAEVGPTLRGVGVSLLCGAQEAWLGQKRDSVAVYRVSLYFGASRDC